MPFFTAVQKRLLSIANPFSEWVSDTYTYQMLLRPYRAYLPEAYYHIIPRDGGRLILPLWGLPEGYGTERGELLRLLREKGELLLTPAQGEGIYLRYENGNYSIDGMRVSQAEMEACLFEREEISCLRLSMRTEQNLRRICGDVDSLMCFAVFNHHGSDPEIAEAYLLPGRKSEGAPLLAQLDTETGHYHSAATLRGDFTDPCPNHPDTGERIEGDLPNWQGTLQKLLEICAYVPGLEFILLTVTVTDDGFRILDLSDDPARLHQKSRSTRERLRALRKRNVEQARAGQTLRKQTKIFLLQCFCNVFCDSGFEKANARMWVRKVVKDLLTFKAATLREKLWCYRRGFFSYRLRQYGLNEDNWRRWLSDRDYYWMRPINNQYEKWIADKVLFRYVAEPMHEYLPAHYFHLIPRGSEMGVMRLPDCPEGYEDNLEGVIALLRDKGALAMKKTTGLRGEGFYKLSCEDGQFAINGEPCSERAMRRHLRTRKDCYCLTEFLTMSRELKHMYVGAVDTLRLMVINRDGRSPRIMNAYLRIGTASSGMTDNISFGGVFCPVDLDTGRYHDAERSEGHMIVSCPVHPDTGSRIEGVIPRWEEIGRVVRDMCLLMPQLEYMGFDVTVTDEGVRVIEINRNQSLHRCPQYGEEIQTYFQQKIAYKQALCRARKNAAGRKGKK